jgi:hypothetical protein
VAELFLFQANGFFPGDAKHYAGCPGVRRLPPPRINPGGHSALCRWLYRNPPIPTRVGPCRALSLEHTGTGTNIAWHCMNAGDSH